MCNWALNNWVTIGHQSYFYFYKLYFFTRFLKFDIFQGLHDYSRVFACLNELSGIFRRFSKDFRAIQLKSFGNFHWIFLFPKGCERFLISLIVRFDVHFFGAQLSGSRVSICKLFMVSVQLGTGQLCTKRTIGQ